MILDTSQVLKFHRRCPLGWRLGYSFRDYSPICQGNEHPASRWNTYSADTFDASTSRFPTHLEMHKSKRPSKELIRYVRRWEHELRLDSRKTSPRWRAERKVMKAECIVFLLRYEPNKERREDRLKEVLKALKIGLQTDSQSSQPRWNAIQRRDIHKLVVRMEETHAFEVAAVEQKEDDESPAPRSCDEIILLLIGAIIILSLLDLIGAIIILLLESRQEAAQQSALVMLLKKAHLIDETVHCYRNPAYATFAVEASPLSAAYSDSLHETAGACGLRDEAIQNYAKYSKCGKSWEYISEWKDDKPGDKPHHYYICPANSWP